MTFLQKNRQRYSQLQYPRRGGGYTAAQITLHTYEAPHTRSLLAAATWLTQRSGPGSYHALCGHRSATDVLQLAPWSYETWHSVPSNNWAIGISAVAYAHQWNSIPARSRNNLVKSMAYAASLAAKWLERVHGREVQARVLTRAQAMRKESGFVTHATMDPGRRTDPGKGFPMKQFLNEFKRLMGQSSSTPSPAPSPSPSTGGSRMATAKENWEYKGTDYVNKNNNSQQAKLARAHEYTFKQPARMWARRFGPIKSVLNAFPSVNKNGYLARTWVQYIYVWARRTFVETPARVWRIRIKPEKTVAEAFPSIRDDGYLMSTWMQYSYLHSRNSAELAAESVEIGKRNTAAIEALAAAEGDHIYAAVAEAMAEHDRRSVAVSVTVEGGADDEEEIAAQGIADGDLGEDEDEGEESDSEDLYTEAEDPEEPSEQEG